MLHPGSIYLPMAMSFSADRVEVDDPLFFSRLPISLILAP